MTRITTIVHFTMPADSEERFLEFWQKSKVKMTAQPGIIGGVMYRGVDRDGAFPFINVARWESANALASGLAATAAALREEGIEVGEVFRELGVSVAQSLYDEAIPYQADGPSVQ